MRVLPAGLAEHLAGRVTTLARCWRLTRLDGAVLGFTDHDVSISFDGTVFSAMDGLSSTGDVARSGLGVGGFEIEGALSATGLDVSDLDNGRFDGATVEFFLVNWADVSQRTLLRSGTLGEVTRADDGFSAEVRGPMQQLETVRGRVFAHTCDADLGDARCGVDLAPLAVTASVVSAHGAKLVVSGLSAYAAGWFSGGGAVALSGAQTGDTFAIAEHTLSGDDAVIVMRPQVAGFAQGDTLSLTPGCDKRFRTCRDTFLNHLNFRGFPHMPGNDKALGYARGAS